MCTSCYSWLWLNNTVMLCKPCTEVDHKGLRCISDFTCCPLGVGSLDDRWYNVRIQQNSVWCEVSNLSLMTSASTLLCWEKMTSFFKKQYVFRITKEALICLVSLLVWNARQHTCLPLGGSKESGVVFVLTFCPKCTPTLTLGSRKNKAIYGER